MTRNNPLRETLGDGPVSEKKIRELRRQVDRLRGFDLERGVELLDSLDEELLNLENSAEAFDQAAQGWASWIKEVLGE